MKRQRRNYYNISIAFTLVCLLLHLLRNDYSTQDKKFLKSIYSLPTEVHNPFPPKDSPLLSFSLVSIILQCEILLPGHLFAKVNTLPLNSSILKIKTRIFRWFKFPTPPKKGSNSPPCGHGRQWLPRVAKSNCCYLIGHAIPLTSWVKWVSY